MNSLIRRGPLVLALSAIACSSKTPPKDPDATYDLSAQAYADGVHVYARRDAVLGEDAGPTPSLSAVIGDATRIMGFATSGPDLTASFPVTESAFTAQISGSEGTLAAIDVPAAFTATPAQTVLHEGDHLTLTLSPAPADGAKVTLRGLPGCLFVLFPDLTTKPLSADGAAVEFDMKPYLDAMTRPECDATFGVRYETSGHMGDGYSGTAAGLREVTVTLHLVNPNATLLVPADAGAD
jgi:hypothetical protein